MTSGIKRTVSVLLTYLTIKLNCDVPPTKRQLNDKPIRFQILKVSERFNAGKL